MSVRTLTSTTSSDGTSSAALDVITASAPPKAATFITTKRRLRFSRGNMKRVSPVIAFVFTSCFVGGQCEQRCDYMYVPPTTCGTITQVDMRAEALSLGPIAFWKNC